MTTLNRFRTVSIRSCLTAVISFVFALVSGSDDVFEHLLQHNQPKQYYP